MEFSTVWKRKHLGANHIADIVFFVSVAAFSKNPVMIWLFVMQETQSPKLLANSKIIKIKVDVFTFL